MDDDLEAALEERVATVNAALEERAWGETPSDLYAAARHLLDAGGKRIRPAMTLLVAEACGRPAGDDGLPAALAVELVHTLSLIHDDIIDKDDLRRGVPAVHEAWSDSLGILAGDLLYAQAFDMLSDVEAPVEDRQTCFRTLTTACRELCEGQALDIELGEQERVSEAEYVEMVEKKTGALFAGATRIGAVLGGADEDVVENLTAYGRQVGVAFQLYDDVLDLEASSETIGKNRGSDIQQGKETLITIHARRQGVDVTASGGDLTLDRRIARLKGAGSIDYARERAREYVDEAVTHLHVLPASDARDHLTSLADHVVDREF